MSGAHLVEAGIDIFQPDPFGNDRIQIEQAAQVEVHEAGKIDREVVFAHDRALQLLPAEQVHRAQTDFAIQRHHAENDCGSAAAQRGYGQIGRRLPSDSFDRIMRPAAG